jgi:hypothetical protein
VRYRFKPKSVETLTKEGWEWEGSELVHHTLNQKIKATMISMLGKPIHADKPPVDGVVRYGIDDSFPLLMMIPPDRRKAAVEEMSQTFTQEMCEPFGPPATLLTEFTPDGFPLSIKLFSNGVAEIGDVEIPRSGLNQLYVRLGEFLNNTTSEQEAAERNDKVVSLMDFTRGSGGSA